MYYYLFVKYCWDVFILLFCLTTRLFLQTQTKCRRRKAGVGNRGVLTPETCSKWRWSRKTHSYIQRKRETKPERNESTKKERKTQMLGNVVFSVSVFVIKYIGNAQRVNHFCIKNELRTATRVSWKLNI